MSINHEGAIPEAQRWAHAALTRRQLVLRSAVSAGAIATAAVLAGVTSGSMLRAENGSGTAAAGPRCARSLHEVFPSGHRPYHAPAGVG
jgi:hypothetical protein